MALRDRHVVGVGAAACAVCCAPPVLGLLGVAGAGVVGTIGAFVFAGAVFAMVVGVAALAGVLVRRRSTAKAAGPVTIELTRGDPSAP